MRAAADAVVGTASPVPVAADVVVDTASPVLIAADAVVDMTNPAPNVAALSAGPAAHHTGLNVVALSVDLEAHPEADAVEEAVRL